MPKKKRWMSVLMLAALCVSTLFMASCAEIPQSEPAIRESEGAQIYTETGMKPVLSNEGYELKADLSTGEIAVLDKKGGKTWYSNPPSRDEDTTVTGYMKNVLNSQLMISINMVTSNNTEGALTEYGSFLEVNRNGELRCKVTQDSIIFVYAFTGAAVEIPVKYTLNEDGFSAEILTGEIVELAKNRLRSIKLLPCFGAGTAEDEGYMLVPDGSGALIHYNNNKSTAANYGADDMAPIYGLNNGTTDKTVQSINQYTTAFTKQEQVYLPIFGAKCNDDGFIGIVDNAAARGNIYAQSGGQNSSFNMVYSGYKYREAGIIRMLQKGFEQKNSEILENAVDAQNIYRVRYVFLEHGKASYTDMSAAYRQYLIDNQGLSSHVEEGDIPFYLNLYGYVRKTKPTLGIPMDQKIELTSFAAAEDIVRLLNENGIQNTVVKYNQWQKNGYYDKIQTKADVENILGGKKQLTQLDNTLLENGGQLFLGMEPMNAYQTGWGFSKVGDALKTAAKSPQMQFEFVLNNAAVDNRYAPWYLIRPQSLMSFFNQFADSFEGLGVGNIALDSVGGLLYSELGSDGISRADAQTISEQLLDRAAAVSQDLMLNEANAYAAVRGGHILDTPFRSSNYDVIDEDIPFYQMVFHGYVNYSLSATNLSSNPSMMYLRCLEMGAAPLYDWVAQNSDELIGSRSDDLFSADYTRWLDFAVQDYAKLNSILSRVKTMTITDHAELGTNVRMTEYGNQVQLIVNYNDTAVTVKGKTIPAKDVLVVE